MRRCVISDIHGCYDEFNALLQVADYNPVQDELILLGIMWIAVQAANRSSNRLCSFSNSTLLL